MQDEEVTSSKADNSGKTDNNPFSAAYTRFKLLPITWRVVGGALLGVVILGTTAYFLPNMKERMKFFTDAALSWLILVVVAVQAYIYDKQWKVMERHLDAIGIGERAYIGIEDMKLVKPLAANESIMIRTLFKNGGKTPAWAFRSHYRAVVTPEPIATVVQKYPVTYQKGTGAFMVAGQVKRVECPLDPFRLSPVQMVLITKKIYCVYVLIGVTFRDYLGHAREFSFRQVYDPAVGEFNDADYDDSATSEEQNPN